MAGGHSFLRTARLPITAYLHEKGGLNYLMLSKKNTMSIVVRMTSLARIVLLPLIERILGLRMRIVAKYTYY